MWCKQLFMYALSKLETVVAQAVVGHLNGEPQILWLSCISNAALLSLLLSAGQNISSKKWFVICFLVKPNIAPMIFHSELRVEQTLVEKRTVKQNNYTFHEINIFSVNVRFCLSLKETQFWTWNETKYF